VHVAVILALELITLTGPDKQVIQLNPNVIVSLRAPRVGEHFAPGTRCLIHTSDGKIIVVQETCTQVNGLLK
jgi:hypothetical protein